MRRRSLLTAAAASAFAAGCSSSPGSSDSRRGRLTYGIWDVAQLPAMRRAAREFERSRPGVRVDVQLTPNGTYWTKLRTACTSGTAPDVFWMNGPNFGLYADAGQLLPLETEGGEAVLRPADYPADLVSLYRWNGVQYGAPKDFDTVGLWFNKELFDRAKVDYPDADWTWQDLITNAQRLTDRRRGVHGIGVPVWAQENYYDSIAQAGGWVISEDRKRSGYRDPRTLEGLRLWVDMIHRYRAAPTLQQITDTDATQLFQSGRIAMVQDASYNAATYYADPELRAKVDVAPLARGRRRATVIHGLGNVVYARTPRPELARDFVRFLSGKRASQIQGRYGTAIPAFHGTQRAWVEGMPEFDLQVFLDAVDYAVPYPTSGNTAAWAHKEQQLLARAWSGDESLDGATTALAKAMNQLLDQEGRAGS
ncbi:MULTISPECIES: ABC transporter substrate-binding protein [Streptomyces]|uniref:ABC transporter substrate-binding protein n=1 Tax=Streptomyces albus (strain ATCC 21838 / DSM 41398 / FERM P-419 / JCM 4703 / NBRC 107858) TaxID=1081613 RepID=A0A0B5FAV7_STRA4|nr:sugar ABC transporter substrate-binding protein [Streptomyces sp. SCSIO ZS0520]AJE87602.1 ABC transporter substrate-binding protein [Streptomyces albus]AOU81903.1 ABC transporter substrate-binding protein [Streptomyces albus]